MESGESLDDAGAESEQRMSASASAEGESKDELRDLFPKRGEVSNPQIFGVYESPSILSARADSRSVCVLDSFVITVGLYILRDMTRCSLRVLCVLKAAPLLSYDSC